MFSRLSIRLKLTLGALLACSVGMLSLSTGFVIQEFNSLQMAKIDQVGTATTVVARNCTAALAFRDKQAAHETLAGLSTLPDIKAAVLYDRDGAVFASHPEGATLESHPSMDLEENTETILGDDLYLLRQSADPDARQGSLLVHADLSVIRSQLAEHTTVGVGAFLFALFVAFLFATALQQRLVGPLLALTHSAEQVVQERDYSKRVQRKDDDEVGALVDSFNDMLGVIQSQIEALATNEANLRAKSRELEQHQAQLEEAVKKRTAELEHTNEELESFCYSISHDLRAPLRAISGYADLVLEDFEDALDEEGRGFLGRIVVAANQMATLIDQLLSMTRLARSDMNVETVNLSGLVDETVQGLQIADPDRRVAVTIAPDIRGRGDEVLLRVVIQNLVGNAWKFTRLEPEAAISFHTEERDGRPVFVVSDNGAGFDMKHSKKLFEPFQRLHAASEFEGSGIGLASCKSIINRHGGDLWADSEEGEDTHFIFTLNPS